MVDQVGGKHYFTGDNVVQHWDVVPGQAPYLLGCASKYASRHRTKKGQEDVEKGISYLEKIIDIAVNYHPEVNWDAMRAWARKVPKMSLLDWTAIEQMYCGLYQEAIDTLRLILEQDYQQPIQRGTAFTKDPVTTNTPRPGESDEATRMRVERRVPRFLETEVTHRVGDISRTEIIRERAAGVDTGPWVINHVSMEALRIRRDTVPGHVFDLFYCRWAPDTYKLEPYVKTITLPRELQLCYTIDIAGGAWVMNIEKVPKEVREMFIDLPREVNGLQHMGLPEWQKPLYREEQTKWTLINEAWHRG